MTREDERNHRANDFLQEGKEDFAANAFATAQIALLGAKTGEIEETLEEQISSDGGARQFYDIAEDADDDLKLATREVADFAVILANDGVDGLEEKFRVARTGGKRGRIARARAFADDAVPLETQFTSRGMDEGFIDDLRQKASHLEQSLTAAVLETAKRVGASARRPQLIKESTKIINSLDPIVRKRYRDNPAKLAAWLFASHVQRDPEPKSSDTLKP
jgi:hypothetical protein